jgi:hypothetical protein
MNSDYHLHKNEDGIDVLKRDVPTPPADSQLDDLRNYLERSYQGALEADGTSYSGAARIAFADYVIARVEAWHRKKLQALISQEAATSRKVGQYQAANKIYPYITDLFVLKDRMPALVHGTIDALLKDTEALMNDNRKDYSNYVAALTKGGDTDGDSASRSESAEH